MKENEFTLEEIDEMSDSQIIFWFQEFKKSKEIEQMRRLLRDECSVNEGLRILTND